MKKPLLILIPLSLLVVGACDKGAPESAEPAPEVAQADPAAIAAEAQQIYKSTCVVCHGESGGGDGPGAAALTPKPRAFSDAEWSASVTDEHLAKVIRDGGAAVGKSPIMPGNPQLKGKDDVLAELVKIVRAFNE